MYYYVVIFHLFPPNADPGKYSRREVNVNADPQL